MSDPTATAAEIVLPEPTADPQWRDARIVGHMRMFNDEMRWIVERIDGTQHRVVAVAVQEDWQSPISPGVGSTMSTDSSATAAPVPAPPCSPTRKATG